MRRRATLFALLSIPAIAAPVGATRGIEGLFSQGRAPIEVGPTPRGLVSTDAEACASCHADIAAEWETSMHRVAWSDPVFQAAFVQEPLEACRNCHAPQRRPGEEPTGVAAHDGVTCATCHVRDGHVLSTGEGRGAPHPVERVPELATSEYCAGCHQFDFPAERGAARGHPATEEPMQDTYEEWADSDAAAAGIHCQGCHMPRVPGPGGRSHRSHRFLGVRDREFLRGALDVEASARRDGREVVVSLRVIPRALGHAFPTGDLFRRGELRAWADDESEAEVIALAREFEDVPERMPDGDVAFVRRERGDSRVAPPGFGPPESYELRVETDATQIHWSLDHLLMPSPMAASQGFAQARVRRVLHRGTVHVSREVTP